jgi:methyltransferase (TIGR00027 family)
MALFRALESARPPLVRLFDDPLARSFLRPRLRLLASASRWPPAGRVITRLIDARWPGVHTSGVARTRFIDDAVEKALAGGVTQAVILGAGFDARPYRIAALSRAAVFEVDHPSTSAVKQAALARRLGRQPAHVRFVPIDFESQTLPEAMAAAGYDAGRRTVFVWEGVTHYLVEAAVDATLRFCAAAAPGSVVIFTYVDRDVIERPETFPGTERLFATLRAADERWFSGLDPSRLEEFLADRGLTLDEDVGAAEYRSRYFGAAADAMRGYEFYRIAVTHVA